MTCCSRSRSLQAAASFALLPQACLAQFLLNDTGLATCGQPTRDGSPRPPVACAGSGQDATFGRDTTFPGDSNGALGFAFAKVCNSGAQAGKPGCPAHPEPGKRPKQWRCTFDKVTGLLWELKLTDGEPYGQQRLFDNRRPGDTGYGGPDDAQGLARAAQADTLCGRADWRVPSASELQSIVHHGQAAAPMLDGRWFPNTLAAAYWTATDASAGASHDPPSAAGHAWAVQFNAGWVIFGERGSALPVRLVAGQAVDPTPPGSDRFLVSADGSEVTDQSTRLVWRRCSQGQQPAAPCAGPPKIYSRANVFDIELPDGWRLPNIKELKSLVDHGRSYPALDPTLFPNAYDEGAYWSGSIVPGTGYVWFVGIGQGAVVYEQHAQGAMRLVRDMPAP